VGDGPAGRPDVISDRADRADSPAPTRDDVRVTRLSTSAPAPLDFVGTAYSHGWAVLEPNRWEADASLLLRTERLTSGRVVDLAIGEGRSSTSPRLRIEVTHLGELDSADAADVRRHVRRMFRLDQDMSPFHALCRQAGGRWEAVGRGLGRLLRSPTVFEDTVKTICTTNVQWGGTRSMVRRIVASLGELGPETAGRSPRAFPTPEAIASADRAALESARLGYRAPYVRELAERVAKGELDLEALRDPDLPTAEIERRLRNIRGVGSYSAATLLMLVGRYDRLPVDSVFRAFVGDRYFAGERPADSEAAAVYAGWGKWKYLAYWFDLWQGSQENV
jgi:3-methyladenine DNA glycosylase/8-oxoguanine DNA glycosylase